MNSIFHLLKIVLVHPLATARTWGGGTLQPHVSKMSIPKKIKKSPHQIFFPNLVSHINK